MNFISPNGDIPDSEQLQKKYIPPIDPLFIKHSESFLASAILLGVVHAEGGVNLEDSGIPSLPFEEAASFLKSRVSLTRAEWDTLEPQVRFRAFTISRLAQCDFIEAVRGELLSSFQDGKGYASRWQDIKSLVEADSSPEWLPGYWENVFRTNKQTCYVAGKLMQYQKNPPPAWRLFIIDDDRTSDICRSLLENGKQGLVLSSSHQFWKIFGFPPYHFQCRTGLQAIYQHQIGTEVNVENPTMKSLRKTFHPLKGFGGNPLDKGSFWKMTDDMIGRANYFGITPDIDSFARSIGIEDVFKMRNIIRQNDYTFVKTGKGTGFYVAKERTPRNKQEQDILNKEKRMCEILSKKDHEIYMIPEYKAHAAHSVDTIMDGKFVELKQVTGGIKKVGIRFLESRKQADNVFIKIDSDFSPEQVRSKISGELKNHPDAKGLLICYFTKTKKLFYWDIIDLK